MTLISSFFLVCSCLDFGSNFKCEWKLPSAKSWHGGKQQSVKWNVIKQDKVITNQVLTSTMKTALKHLISPTCGNQLSLLNSCTTFISSHLWESTEHLSY
jgi:hypothetical protein